MGRGLGHGHGQGLKELFPASPRTAASLTRGSPDASSSVRAFSDLSPDFMRARMSARRTSSLCSVFILSRIAGSAVESPIWPSAHAALRRESSLSSLRTFRSPAGALPPSPRSWPIATPLCRELESSCRFPRWRSRRQPLNDLQAHQAPRWRPRPANDATNDERSVAEPSGDQENDCCPDCEEGRESAKAFDS